MLRTNRLNCQMLSGIFFFFIQHERRYTDFVATPFSRWRNLRSSHVYRSTDVLSFLTFPRLSIKRQHYPVLSDPPSRTYLTRKWDPRKTKECESIFLLFASQMQRFGTEMFIPVAHNGLICIHLFVSFPVMYGALCQKWLFQRTSRSSRSEPSSGPEGVSEQDKYRRILVEKQSAQN